ncbi:hypothetical protein JF770_15020 [Mycobacterium intracellulare]|uniref:hypothetical protein n=1 Tax=Mycobacterium intracellulare TaxID=1767 RepID=UPI001CD95BB4|nr:hypothetical protein [Mycobacterium intracellulare]MCA2304877.1 hypothetical protein [Mycobacterium intracellulare]MCA2347092.1 hypothetical protein [Mycobacterium intracellulare]
MWSVQFFFDLSIARPPNGRERAVLKTRLNRLAQMEQSAAHAGTQLQEQLQRRVTSPGDVRIRHGFVRLLNTDSAADTTNRNATRRDQRPPSTRLMSPRGRALSFFLTTLFEAQMRLAPGQAATRNELPLKAENDLIGWTDYIAADAQDATEGRIFVDVPTKKARQIQSSLVRLHNENLISLPPAKGRHRRYQDFVLKREDARPRGDNSVYRVPEHEFFTVPVSLFTKGWIHVLEDSELVLLLIAARMHAEHGDVPQPLPSGPRKLHYGLSRDSFEAGHRVLDYLGILDVISDYQRNDDGKVDGFADRGAKPHLLRFHPETLDRPAFPAIVDTITEQIAKSEGL